MQIKKAYFVKPRRDLSHGEIFYQRLADTPMFCVLLIDGDNKVIVTLSGAPENSFRFFRPNLSGDCTSLGVQCVLDLDIPEEPVSKDILNEALLPGEILVAGDDVLIAALSVEGFHDTCYISLVSGQILRTPDSSFVKCSRWRIWARPEDRTEVSAKPVASFGYEVG